jgi:uncharacterized protein (DUF2236 family)
MSATIVQRRASDVRIAGAAGYALALQVAHPTIAAGVREHSSYATNPWGRLFGTIDFVALLVYGSRDQSARATTQLREMHRRIRGTDPDGTRYSALEPSAYAWVHATLADAVVRGHHYFGKRFTPAEKDMFWGEWLTYGAMLGIRDGDLPDTWTGYEAYRRDMVDNVLTHNDVVDSVQQIADAGAVGGSPFGWLPARAWGVVGKPGGRYVAFLGKGTMGEELREKLRVDWTPKQDKVFRRIAAVHRSAQPMMVPPLTKIGPLALKVRRREIAKGPFV